jgi:hypothetical protein
LWDIGPVAENAYGRFAPLDLLSIRRRGERCDWVRISRWNDRSGLRLRNNKRGFSPFLSKQICRTKREASEYQDRFKVLSCAREIFDTTACSDGLISQEIREGFFDVHPVYLKAADDYAG